MGTKTRNPKIARALKYYRKLNHMTVPQVADYLEKQNLKAAVKTIYGWESGQTQPSADTLMSLCTLYGITNVLDTFGYADEEEQLILSEEEKQLIGSYRKHSQMRDAVKRLLEIPVE